MDLLDQPGLNRTLTIEYLVEENQGPALQPRRWLGGMLNYDYREGAWIQWLNTTGSKPA